MARKPLPATVDAKTAALRAEREAVQKPPTPTPTTKAAKTNSKAPAPTKPAKPERPKGVGYYIRKATIAAYPEVATTAVIESALADAGFRGTKKSTTDTFRTDCLAVLRIAQEMGKLAERRTRAARGAVETPAVETAS
jgi:hypothetical protein